MCSRDVPPVDSKVCGGGVVHVQVVYAVVQLFAQYAAIIYCAKSQLQIVQVVVDYCAIVCTSLVCGDILLCKKSTTNIIYAILNAISGRLLCNYLHVH